VENPKMKLKVATHVKTMKIFRTEQVKVHHEQIEERKEKDELKFSHQHQAS